MNSFWQCFKKNSFFLAWFFSFFFFLKKWFFSFLLILFNSVISATVKVGIKENNRDETASNNKTYILNPLTPTVCTRQVFIWDWFLVGGRIIKVGSIWSISLFCNSMSRCLSESVRDRERRNNYAVMIKRSYVSLCQSFRSHLQCALLLVQFFFPF